MFPESVEEAESSISTVSSQEYNDFIIAIQHNIPSCPSPWPQTPPAPFDNTTAMRLVAYRRAVRFGFFTDK